MTPFRTIARLSVAPMLAAAAMSLALIYGLAGGSVLGGVGIVIGGVLLHGFVEWKLSRRRGRRAGSGEVPTALGARRSAPPPTVRDIGDRGGRNGGHAA